MVNKIIKAEKEIEIHYSFSEPNRVALYITHPKWNLSGMNIITEDQRFVMGDDYGDTNYVPLPSEIFKESIENLAKRGALKINPNLLKESIDFDPAQLDYDINYILDTLSVLIRIREDSKGAHTMKMIGLEESLIILADKIGLPHPFDSEKYPYKNIFRDESGAKGKIAALG